MLGLAVALLRANKDIASSEPSGGWIPTICACKNKKPSNFRGLNFIIT